MQNGIQIIAINNKWNIMVTDTTVFTFNITHINVQFGL